MFFLNVKIYVLIKKKTLDEDYRNEMIFIYIDLSKRMKSCPIISTFHILFN